MPRWLRRLIYGAVGISEDAYVDPLLVEQDMYALAKMEDRQRDVAKKLKCEGKSLLVGYKPPEPYNGDRIEAHAHKEGVIMPTQRKQANFLDLRIDQEQMNALGSPGTVTKKMIYPIRPTFKSTE